MDLIGHAKDPRERSAGAQKSGKTVHHDCLIQKLYCLEESVCSRPSATNAISARCQDCRRSAQSLFELPGPKCWTVQAEDSSVPPPA
jgi:hypothetical protein